MLAVFKKELKSYLLTPIGYVFIGLFILMFSIMFFRTIYSSNVINFEYLFYNGSTILTFITPILTMRLFAEERKNGTEQLLLTSPRSIVSVVLGKFFAAGVIILITCLLTFMYFGVLSYFGQPSFKVALSTIFGFILLAMAYVSFGMFASSLTENQIVAGVLPIGIFILMIFLPTSLSSFSLISMFDKFPEGMISLTEVVAFVSFQALFVLLTILVLQRRKCVK